MSVGEKIKEYRKRMGLTQTELGEMLGVQKNAVSKWECGRVEDIPCAKIKAMATIFGVSTSCLIDDEVAPKSDNNDFIRAMLGETKNLTEEDKQLLLSMARQLNAAKR